MLRELQLEILEGLLDEGRAPVAIERLSEERPLTPAQQLTIYRRSVASTLAATLAEVYPVCRRLVGERFFGAAAAAYVRVARSRSPDLNEYGDGFGSFLAGFAPAASLPYLPDVARFEWAWHRAFHAPDDGAIDMDVLASSVASADPARVVFRLPRSATLLDSPYPIDRIWQVNQSDHRGDETVDLSSGGVRLLVRRHGLAPCMESLSAPESHFLRAVAEGLDLGDICLGLSQEHPGTDEGRLLAAAITRGWVSGFEAGDAHPGGEAMTLALYQRVVLTRDLPKEGLRAGDVGVIVEHYPARADVPESYELEVFAANGQTVAVVSVPASAVREATEHEVLSVREMARA